MPSAASHSSHALLLSLLVLAVSSPARTDGLSQRTPAEGARGSIETVSGVLAQHQTLQDVSAFVGSQPARCTRVPGGATICVFRLSKKEPGWWPLASALDTGDRLNLVCEFPANDAPRAEDSCSVQAQRSNRSYYRRQLPGRKSGSRTPKSIHRRVEAELSAEAKQILASARTALELSTLVGDAPSDCRSGKRDFLCTWRTTAASYGHGTLAMTIGAPFQKKVRMMCHLPRQGLPRAPDSCTVEIGS